MNNTREILNHLLQTCVDTYGQGGEDKILQATLQKYLKATLRAYQYSGV